MGGHVDSNWNDLIGQPVRIHQDGRFIRSGYVEDVTHAADALWLQARGTEPRALYLKADGFMVNVIPATAEEQS